MGEAVQKHWSRIVTIAPIITGIVGKTNLFFINPSTKVSHATPLYFTKYKIWMRAIGFVNNPLNWQYQQGVMMRNIAQGKTATEIFRDEALTANFWTRWLSKLAAPVRQPTVNVLVEQVSLCLVLTISMYSVNCALLGVSCFHLEDSFLTLRMAP